MLASHFKQTLISLTITITWLLTVPVTKQITFTISHPMKPQPKFCAAIHDTVMGHKKAKREFPTKCQKWGSQFV